MITQTATELASESAGVAATLYNAFETPITILVAAVVIGIIIKAAFSHK